MPTALLHAVARLAPPDPRTDAQLVAAFLSGTDADAFGALVHRHGPAVLGVCQRALGRTPDAEDAFQATFLVLVRRARSTAWRASLGPWLYGVARKVARKARAVRAKRLTNERAGVAMHEPTTAPPEPDDAGAVLDEELNALPALYRVPLVLCEIQGASRRDAARELGLSEGTLSSRLARGRKLLRERLAARGVAPAAAGLAVAVPAGLANATVRNAVSALARTAGAVPAGVLFLTDEVTKTMIVKWKLALTMVATCVALTGFGAWRSEAQPTPAGAAPAEKASSGEKVFQIKPTTEAPAPRVKIVARVGKTNLITDQDVTAAVYQRFHREFAALDAPARTAKHRQMYIPTLCKAIERELVLDEMYAKLEKANRGGVIEEIREFATQAADRQMRMFRADTGARTDDEFAAILRTQGLTVQVIRRQMERQLMAEQYARSALKEKGETDGRKWVEELWWKGVVQVFEQ